jgi:hypothetical protein
MNATLGLPPRTLDKAFGKHRAAGEGKTSKDGDEGLGATYAAWLPSHQW